MNETLARLIDVQGAARVASLSSWSDRDLVDGVAEVFALEQALAAARLSIIGELVERKVPKRVAATADGPWLAGALQVSRYAAGKMVRLAKALRTEAQGTREVLAAGAISVEQAAVIVTAVRQLPEMHRPEGETHMLRLAETLTAAQLREAGLRLFDEVDPQGAQERREVSASAGKRRRARSRGLTLSQADEDAMVLLHARMESETADVIRAALDPLCELAAAGPDPTGTTETSTPDDKSSISDRSAADLRTPAARRLDALEKVCRTVIAARTQTDPSLRPTHGSSGSSGSASRSDRRRDARRDRRQRSKKRPPVDLRRTDTVAA
jgi:hypothetical protein